MRIESALDASAIKPLGGIGEMGEGQALPGASTVGGPGGVSFGDMLTGAVQQANDAAHVASAKANAVAHGSLDDLHGTMISAKEAEISLHLVGTIRNKLLDAFHEIWRTSV